MHLLKWLNKNLSFSIPIFLILGFLFGLLIDARALSLTITPLTLLMIYPMMVGIDLPQITRKGEFKLQFWALFINFVPIPLVAYLLGLIAFPQEPALALGLLLTALLPTSGMTISWTGFARGNIAAAIKITVLGLLLGSVLTPVYIQLLLGAHLPIALGRIFKQILLFVLLPLALGQLTRFWLLKSYDQTTFSQKIAPKFPPFSTLGVLGIVFVAMALKAQDLYQSPAILLQLLLPLLALYLINYLISTLAAKFLFTYEDGVALVFGTVMRNLSIALALAMTSFGAAGAQAALLIALAYIIQVQSAAWYVRRASHWLK